MSSFIPAEPRSNTQIEAMTLSIIQRYQPGVLYNGEPFEIERFFDCELENMTGVSIDYQPLEYGIYGYTDSDRMECVMSLDLAYATAPHEKYFYRSTMAHEIGHAILHVKDYRRKRAILRSLHKKGHELRLHREEKDIPLYRNPEWQAFRFGGALLMPEQAFREAVREGLGEKGLSQRFGVNPAFIRTRMKALKINIF